MGFDSVYPEIKNMVQRIVEYINADVCRVAGYKTIRIPVQFIFCGVLPATTALCTVPAEKWWIEFWQAFPIPVENRAAVGTH